MNEAPKKHHYIPKCYLKQWCGADCMLCEYQQFNGRIVPRRVHPSQTGWVDSLYSVEALPPEVADYIEQVFFLRVDQEASDALDFLTRNRHLDTPALRTGWSRFLMSLMQRHPGKLAEHREKAERVYHEELPKFRDLYPSMRRPTDPELFDEFCAQDHTEYIGKLIIRSLQQACDLPNVGQQLNRMRLDLIFINGTPLRFITSDNPLTVNTGLGRPECRIMLPISPRGLVLMTNRDEVAEHTINELENGDLIQRINAQVIHQTYRFAYAICENQLDLMAQHWPAEKPATYAHLVPPATPLARARHR
jgi:hypothetical protein